MAPRPRHGVGPAWRHELDRLDATCGAACLAAAVVVGTLNACVFFSYSNGGRPAGMFVWCVALVAGVTQVIPALLGICLLAWTPAEERHARIVGTLALCPAVSIVALGAGALLCPLLLG